MSYENTNMLQTLEPRWQTALVAERDKKYFCALIERVKAAYRTEESVYPPPELVFNAFAQTPFSEVRVVILGQDPYHGPDQAHGLAFSVPDSVPIPPSLRNIYRELASDTGGTTNTGGNLERWAHQGVLLLNSTLTVRADAAGSHRELGWEQFTDAVIQTISEQKEHVVFMLWGAFAQSKAAYIDHEKHLVLTAPHPSPLSAHRGFLGCRHFSACNTYLHKHNRQPIVW